MKDLAEKNPIYGAAAAPGEAAIESDLQEIRRENDALRQQVRQLQEVNQSLADSEQRLRLAIATGRIGLWVWNSTDVANAGDWSPRLKEIFGLPFETEVTHEIFLDAVHPADRERVNEEVMQALGGANGGEYRCEYRIVHQGDGAMRWATARGQAFFDAEGNAVRFIGTVMDITERKTGEESIALLNAELELRVAERTKDLARSNAALVAEIEERKRAEKRLRQSENYLAEAQRLSRTGSFGWSVATGALVWSDETFCIFGYPKTVQPTLEQVFERIHPEDTGIVKQTLERAIQDAANLDFEHRLRMPDGTVRYVHTVANAMQDVSGEVEFVGAVVDVTQKKKDEEALSNSERLARGQLAGLTQMLEALARESDPDQLPRHVANTIQKQLGAFGITIWERNGDCFELLGVTEEGQFLNRSEAADFEGSIPVAGQAPPLWVEGLQSGSHLLIEDLDPESARIVLGDGRAAIWSQDDLSLPFAKLKVHLSAQGGRGLLICPLTLAGQLAGIIGIQFKGTRTFGRDEIELTKALAHQAMLSIRLMRLSQQSRRAAVVAERNRMARDIHDTLAQGFAGVIMQLEAARGVAERGGLAETTAHIERAEELARSSLGEARRSVRALRPRSLREGTLCAALADLLKRMSAGTRLHAEFQIEGEQREIPVDREEGLLRIAQESLANTIKHAQATTFRVTLSFGADEVRLLLTDNGRGFDPDAGHEGFGLVGMKERVDQMGGRFVVRSEPGQGAEILVTLEQATALRHVNENDHH